MQSVPASPMKLWLSGEMPTIGARGRSLVEALERVGGRSGEAHARRSCGDESERHDGSEEPDSSTRHASLYTRVGSLRPRTVTSVT